MYRYLLIGILFTSISCTSTTTTSGSNKIGKVTLLEKSSQYIPAWVGNPRSYWTEENNIYCKIFIPEQTDITNGFITATNSWGSEIKDYIKQILLKKATDPDTVEVDPLLKEHITKRVVQISTNKIQTLFSIQKSYWERTHNARNGSRYSYTIYLLTKASITQYTNLISSTFRNSKLTNKKREALLIKIIQSPLPTPR